MFRTVFPSIIRSSKLHICLLTYVGFWSPDDGRKDRPKHVERFTRINNLRNRCMLYYKNNHIDLVCYFYSTLLHVSNKTNIQDLYDCVCRLVELNSCLIKRTKERTHQSLSDRVFAAFEVVTPMLLNIRVFWYVMPFVLVIRRLCLEVSQYLCLQDYSTRTSSPWTYRHYDPSSLQ